jgi:hypothetical protein
MAPTTGIEASQRWWLIPVMAACALGTFGLMSLNLAAWLGGTVRVPSWARRAWWGNRNDAPLVDGPAVGNTVHAVRVAIAVVVVGVPIAVLGALLQGLLVGWLVNNRRLLTDVEAAIVLVEVGALIAWSAYLALGSWQLAKDR